MNPSPYCPGLAPSQQNVASEKHRLTLLTGPYPFSSPLKPRTFPPPPHSELMTSLPVSLRKEKPSKGTAPVLAPHPCSCWPSVRVSELDLAGLQGQTPPLCAATFSSCFLEDNSSEHAPTPALVILKFSLTTEYSHQQTKVALTASFSKTEIKQKKKNLF